MRDPMLFLILLLGGLLITCTSKVPDEAPLLQPGIWRMELDLNGETLPLNFTLGEDEKGEWKMTIQNGEEVIHIDSVQISGDSLFIRLPLYDSEFRSTIHAPDHITGIWVDHLRGRDYSIPFIARGGEAHRFAETSVPATDLTGPWEVHFSPGSEKEHKAIGIFDQHTDGRTTGTFVTETGDHRFLEGVTLADTLKLSAFDGSHAYLYTAILQGDSLKGTFWSGTHWQEPWIAVRNPNYTLEHPDSLTTLKEGHTMVDFEFPDLEGTMVSPHDPRFKNKPLLIQIMGSWCPNCVDETHLLNDLYATYHDRGLEVIALAFEKHDDRDRAINGLERFRKALGVEYPILYAGKAGKETTAKELPFLERVLSYPTCIYIDHRGTVRRIRTGFYGPGTGEHHDRMRAEIERFVERLVAERNASLAKSDR